MKKDCLGINVWGVGDYSINFIYKYNTQGEYFPLFEK